MANNYYAQPLLQSIAARFDVGTAAAGLVVTASQLGHAAGLLLLVPLGDVLQRRRLIVVLPCLCALALAVAAAAPSLLWLGAAAAVASATSVVVQILVAFLLSGDPYNYSEGVIGLFALVGAAGALVAQAAGRLHDRGLGHAGTGPAWRSASRRSG